MLPTTRTTSARKSTKEFTPKRQKTSEASEGIGEVMIDLQVTRADVCTSDADPIRTAWNALESPLLRLPAELRNKIWKLAFAEMAISVSSSGSNTSKPDYKLQYRLFETSSAGHLLSLKRNHGPQLVCKQYWSEASEVFISSCNFMFRGNDLEQFLLAQAQIASRVRRVTLRLLLILPIFYSRVALSVGKLRSLEGLCIEIDCDPIMQELMEYLDIVNDTDWRHSTVGHVIRASQQHPLKEALTKVTIKRHTPDSDTPAPGFEVISLTTAHIKSLEGRCRKTRRHTRLLAILADKKAGKGWL